MAKRLYKQSEEDNLEEALFVRICTSLHPGMQISLEVVQFLAQILDLNVSVIVSAFANAVSAFANAGAPKVHCYEGDHANMHMSFSIAHDFQAGMQSERCCRDMIGATCLRHKVRSILMCVNTSLVITWLIWLLFGCRCH